jgi:invasion protein IalB
MTHLSTRRIAILKHFSLLILCGAMPLCSGTADAQQQPTSTVYEDWTLVCTFAFGGGNSCGLVQVQKVKGQSTAISQIGVSRSTRTDPLKISIEIGPNAWVRNGIQLIVSDKSSISAAFKWCNSIRCVADADLSDADIKSLRAQKDPGKIAYKTASQADVSIPVSFSGFREALDALQRQ